jgi:hypothetical protein
LNFREDIYDHDKKIIQKMFSWISGGKISTIKK